MDSPSNIAVTRQQSLSASAVIAMLALAFTVFSHYRNTRLPHLSAQVKVQRVGNYRDTIFDSQDQYAIDQIEIKVANSGSAPALNIVVAAESEFGQPFGWILAQEDFEYDTGDGVFHRCGERQVVLSPRRKATQLRLCKLQPGLAYTCVLWRLIPRGERSSKPAIRVWDDAGVVQWDP